MNVAVSVLGYGSVYQAGYVFSIDDTTAATGSIGGTVLQQSDVTFGAVWSPDETLNASSLTDGSGNSSTIVAALGTLSGYAAPLCTQVTDGGYTDWYLPAIDELDGGSQSAFTTLLPLGVPAATTSEYYWSSTEVNAAEADSVHVGGVLTSATLSEAALNKSQGFGVRCARAMTN
ncbi:DUF1566 domain-containing protein [Pararobbsia silviterrae]|uniref:DUF1566 domain-containing protein n=1 Tax=Pararobbsia silviterrae TaxID=1792498 RepID=A0A494X6N0_9BURK|nr:DUF1566 domain-containing protein [Pararobbsia silviterrae]